MGCRGGRSSLLAAKLRIAPFACCDSKNQFSSAGLISAVRGLWGLDGRTSRAPPGVDHVFRSETAPKPSSGALGSCGWFSLRAWASLQLQPPPAHSRLDALDSSHRIHGTSRSTRRGCSMRLSASSTSGARHTHTGSGSLVVAARARGTSGAARMQPEIFTRTRLTSSRWTNGRIWAHSVRPAHRPPFLSRIAPAAHRPRVPELQCSSVAAAAPLPAPPRRLALSA